MRLEPGLAPSGLVFVIYDRAGAELERVPLMLSDGGDFIEAIAERHGAATAAGVVGALRVFDGDSGELVMVIDVEVNET